LNQPSVADQIGTITPAGPPPIASVTPTDTVINAFIGLSDIKQAEIVRQYNEYIYGPKYNGIIDEIKINPDFSITGGSAQISFDTYLRTVWFANGIV
jgi:hypothetical protein